MCIAPISKDKMEFPNPRPDDQLSPEEYSNAYASSSQQALAGAGAPFTNRPAVDRVTGTSTSLRLFVTKLPSKCDPQRLRLYFELHLEAQGVPYALAASSILDVYIPYGPAGLLRNFAFVSFARLDLMEMVLCTGPGPGGVHVIDGRSVHMDVASPRGGAGAMPAFHGVSYPHPPLQPRRGTLYGHAGEHQGPSHLHAQHSVRESCDEQQHERYGPSNPHRMGLRGHEHGPPRPTGRTGRTASYEEGYQHAFEEIVQRLGRINSESWGHSLGHVPGRGPIPPMQGLAPSAAAATQGKMVGHGMDMPAPHDVAGLNRERYTNGGYQLPHDLPCGPHGGPAGSHYRDAYMPVNFRAFDYSRGYQSSQQSQLNQGGDRGNGGQQALRGAWAREESFSPRGNADSHMPTAPFGGVHMMMSTGRPRDAEGPGLWTPSSQSSRSVPAGLQHESRSLAGTSVTSVSTLSGVGLTLEHNYS